MRSQSCFSVLGAYTHHQPTAGSPPHPAPCPEATGSTPPSRPHHPPSASASPRPPLPLGAAPPRAELRGLNAGRSTPTSALGGLCGRGWLRGAARRSKEPRQQQQRQRQQQRRAAEGPADGQAEGEAGDDPHRLLQQLILSGNLIKEAVRRLQLAVAASSSSSAASSSASSSSAASGGDGEALRALQ
uniref:GSK-3-binding protein FRAT2 n=1 Tax=Cairina moschata TaxID=8855 RepID=A0A8C3B738_CAIMO